MVFQDVFNVKLFYQHPGGRGYGGGKQQADNARQHVKHGLKNNRQYRGHGNHVALNRRKNQIAFDLLDADIQQGHIERLFPGAQSRVSGFCGHALHLVHDSRGRRAGVFFKKIDKNVLNAMLGFAAGVGFASLYPTCSYSYFYSFGCLAAVQAGFISVPRSDGSLTL